MKTLNFAVQCDVPEHIHPCQLANAIARAACRHVREDVLEPPDVCVSWVVHDVEPAAAAPKEGE